MFQFSLCHKPAQGTTSRSYFLPQHPRPASVPSFYHVKPAPGTAQQDRWRLPVTQAAKIWNDHEWSTFSVFVLAPEKTETFRSWPASSSPWKQKTTSKRKSKHQTLFSLNASVCYLPHAQVIPNEVTQQIVTIPSQHVCDTEYIGVYFVGIFPYIGLKYRPYTW